jgi:23S rRNA (cytosine1962-C5)-methyltransferase
MEKIKYVAESSSDYELLDSGDGEKLERFGGMVLRRPDPQAIWPKKLREEKWAEVSAWFEQKGPKGKWKIIKVIGDSWKVSFDRLVFNLELLPSKHLGVFPEQSSHWKWLQSKISSENKKLKVLNLFGYTGGSTLACAKLGCDVCHVDSSKFAVDLAVKNLKDSGLGGAPVRFIVDDVRKFVEREIKRGNKYDIIIMDPPVYGKGAKKEVWKIEEDLPELMTKIKKIISDEPVSVILNGYSSGYSAVTYAQILSVATENFGGELAPGELFIKESQTDRLLPCGIFALWQK